MSFLNPIGLWGFIGIPIVILIYIIKNRFTEMTVSSTYIWRMSEKFMKKKNPFSFMNGLLSLFLQLMAIAILSFTVADPQFEAVDPARNYLFIIDSSASMQFEVDGVSRFDQVKSEIEDIVKRSTDGSVYSLCVAGETADLSVLNSEDKTVVYQALENISVSSLSSNLDGALKLAQNMFNDDPSLTVYVATDTTYGSLVNLDVLNGYREETNASLLTAESKYVDDKLTVDVTLFGYEEMEVEVVLQVDEEAELTKKIALEKETERVLQFTTEFTSFTQARITLKSEDGLGQDNEIILYSQEEKNEVKTLLVSDQPFYLSSVLKTVEDVSLEMITSQAFAEKFSEEATGYNLYIFDGVAPATMPKDGAVWFFGQKENIPESGFIIQREETLNQGGYLEYAKGTSTAYKEVTASLRGGNIAISQYYGYSFVKDFVTILSYNDEPVLCVGNTPYGYREVVFHFDLHRSNLPLLYDYVILINNLVSYSSPNVLPGNLFSCGDKVEIYLPRGLQSAKLVSPMGNDTFIDVNSASAEVRLSEVGSYSLILQSESEESIYRFYSLFPSDEGVPFSEGEKLALEGEQAESSRSGIYHDLTWFILALLVFIMIDWMVYVYEQRKFY